MAFFLFCLENRISHFMQIVKMTVLRQTACMVVNPVVLDNFNFLFNRTSTTAVSLRLNDGSFCNLFLKAGA